MAQAQSLLQRWRQQQAAPAAIYASPLLRAQQTAAVFQQDYALPVHTLPTLREFACLSYPTVAGMLGEERALLAQHYWQTAAPAHRDGADADSFLDFYRRVADFRNTLDSFAADSIFFGHGIWIGMLAWQLLGSRADTLQDKQQFRRFQTALPMYNTVVYRLDMQGEVCQLVHIQDLQE